MALFLVAVAPTSVWAQDGKRILVLPVAVDGGDDIAAFTMTGALERAARDAGRQPTVSSESRESIAAIAGCPGELTGCIDAISEALAVDEVLYGDGVRTGESSYTVKVVYLAVGREPIEREFTVTTALPEEVGAALAPRVSELLAGTLPAEPEPEPAPEPVAEPAPAPLPAPPPPPPAPGFALERVGVAPWVIAGAGVAVAVTGGVLGVVGEGKQGDIDDAPTDTVADLEALEDLEAEADGLTGAGNLLMVAGSVAAVAGLGWAVFQATRVPADQRAPSVAVVPTVHVNAVGVTVRVAGW